MGGDEGLHDLTVPMRRRGGLDRIFLVLRIILLVSTRAGTIVARQPAMAGGSAGWLKRFFPVKLQKKLACAPATWATPTVITVRQSSSSLRNGVMTGQRNTSGASGRQGTVPRIARGIRQANCYSAIIVVRAARGGYPS